MIAQALDVYDALAAAVGEPEAKRVLQTLAGLTLPSWSQTRAALICRDLAGRETAPSCGQLALRHGVSRSAAAHWLRVAARMRTKNPRKRPRGAVGS